MTTQQTTNRPVVIGSKPVANYALAVSARLGEGATQVVLRARGEHISKAVDAANKAINLGLPVSRGQMKWGQEPGPQGKPVSFVEVELIAKAAARKEEEC